MQTKLVAIGVIALAVAGVAARKLPEKAAPAGCASGRCVWPAEEVRKMTTQSVGAPRAREIMAALDAVAKAATAKATFALG